MNPKEVYLYPLNLIKLKFITLAYFESAGFDIKEKLIIELNDAIYSEYQSYVNNKIKNRGLIAKLLGSIKSRTKSLSSKKNGRLGGRPKKLK